MLRTGLTYDVRNGATDGDGTARAGIFDEACMAIDTIVLLADGEHSPVQFLAGRGGGRHQRWDDIGEQGPLVLPPQPNASTSAIQRVLHHGRLLHQTASWRI